MEIIIIKCITISQYELCLCNTKFTKLFFFFLFFGGEECGGGVNKRQNLQNFFILNKVALEYFKCKIFTRKLKKKKSSSRRRIREAK